MIFRIDKRSDIAIIQEYTTRAGVEFHGNESVHIAECEPPRYREDFLLRPKQYSFENGLCGNLKNTIRQQSVNIISSTILIRSLIGVDRKEAMRRFSTFLSNMELNSEQEEFLMTVISYVCENGDITKEIVVNEPPFDERLGVFNGYMGPLAKYIDDIHKVVSV